jgi:hypothetical protein
MTRNYADDEGCGFASVFLGIEIPDESGLIASHKLQNTRRSLLDSIATIQSYGIQVMGGLSWASTRTMKTSSTAWWTLSKKSLSFECAELQLNVSFRSVATFKLSVSRQRAGLTDSLRSSGSATNS